MVKCVYLLSRPNNKQLLDEVEHDIMNYQNHSVLSAEAKG